MKISENAKKLLENLVIYNDYAYIEEEIICTLEDALERAFDSQDPTERDSINLYLESLKEDWFRDAEKKRISEYILSEGNENISTLNLESLLERSTYKQLTECEDF